MAVIYSLVEKKVVSYFVGKVGKSVILWRILEFFKKIDINDRLYR
jgi:hypothetical protein